MSTIRGCKACVCYDKRYPKWEDKVGGDIISSKKTSFPKPLKCPLEWRRCPCGVRILPGTGNSFVIPVRKLNPPTIPGIPSSPTPWLFQKFSFCAWPLPSWPWPLRAVREGDGQVLETFPRWPKLQVYLIPFLSLTLWPKIWHFIAQPNRKTTLDISDW